MISVKERMVLMNKRTKKIVAIVISSIMIGAAVLTPIVQLFML